jgi:hypothetical protein
VRDSPSSELVPDPVCQRELGIGKMTWWRLEFGRREHNKPPHPDFPARYRLNNRNYRRRDQFERLKESLKTQGGGRAS